MVVVIVIVTVVTIFTVVAVPTILISCLPPTLAVRRDCALLRLGIGVGKIY
jgi:hypothetical protein